MRWLRISLFTLAGVLAVLLTAVTVLLTVDFGRFKVRIETAATEFLGRELRIDGVLHANLGASIEVFAEDVYLANPDWATNDAFVTVEKLDIAVSGWSLINGPIQFQRIEINGVRINIEKNENGAASWTFDAFTPKSDEATAEAAPADTEAVGRLPVMLGYAAINDTRVSYSSPTMSEPLLLVADSLVSNIQDEQLKMNLTGSLNGTPLRFEKTTGPLENLLSYQDVTVDLNGNVGEIEIQGSMWADHFLEPRRPLLEIKINGPNARYLTDILSMQPITSGPLELSISVQESDEQMLATLSGTFGEFKYDVNGHFQDIQELNDIRLQVAADGPDIGTIIRLAGGEYAETDPFSINGQVVRSGPDVTIEDVLVLIGENKLSIDGHLPDFPTPNDANLSLLVSGPDFGRFNRLFGMPGRLGGAFNTTLDVSPNDDGRTLLNLDVNSQFVRIQLNSLLSASEKFADSTVQLNLSGADISIVAAAAGFDGLPAEKFEIAGTAEKDSTGYQVQNVRALVGDDLIRLDGHIGDQPLAGETDFEFDISGSDLGASFMALGASAENLPKGAYHLTGRVQKQDDKLWLRDIESTIGDGNEYQLSASGFLTIGQELRDSQLTLHAKGASLAALAELARVDGIPDFPFEIRSDIRRGSASTYFENGLFNSGIVAVDFAGFVGDKPLEDDLEFTFIADVPRMRDVISEFGVDVTQIPTGDLAASGTLQSKAGDMSLQTLSMTFAGAKLDASGIIGLLPDLDGTKLNIVLSGDDLSRLLPPEMKFDSLAHDFALEGGFGLIDNLLVADGLNANIGKTKIGGEVQFVIDPVMQSGSFVLTANSPDLFELIPTAKEVSVPRTARMKFRGGGHWSENYWNFDDVRIDLGEGYITVTGGLDGPPSFDRTNLAVEFYGSSMRNLSVIAGRELPDHQLRLKAQMIGTENQMTLEHFELTFGESDLRGDFTMRAGEVPAVKIDVSSQLFDITEYEQKPGEDPAPPPETSKDRKVIPDTPLPLEFLRSFDADINIDFQEFRALAINATGVNLDARLSGGALHIDDLSLDTRRGGTLKLTAGLEPNDTAGADFDLSIDGNDMVMGFVAESEEDLQHLPLLELRTELAAEGATVRELAGSLDGYFRLVGGQGRMKAGSFTMFTQDFIAQVINTVNPFAKSDPYTNVECSAVLLRFEDGEITGKPAIVQKTDKLLISANTEIDLKTEELLADIKTIPQKGLGISVSSLINPYIGVTGTLASPSLVLNPESILIEGGIAVATAGLSVLAKGFRDRFLSDKDPCGTAIAAADEIFESPDGH